MGEFEGDEVLLAKLSVGACEFPTAVPLHKGDEVVVVMRVQVDSIEFPAGETAVRKQKAKVVRRKIGRSKTSTFAAAIIGDLDRSAPLAQWLSDEVDAREGRQRLGSDEPDWLAPEPPVEAAVVEMGDGPAATRRARRGGHKVSRSQVEEAAATLDEDIAAALGEDAQMSDDEWEASGGRVDAD